MNKILIYLSILLCIFRQGYAQTENKNTIDKKYWQIQFKQLPNLAKQQELQKEGIELLEYLQENTYLAYASTSTIQKSGATQILGITQDLIDKKIAPTLKTLAPTQIIDVQIVFYKTVDKNTISTSLQNYHLNLVKYYPELQILQAKGKVSDILLLAKEQAWLQSVLPSATPKVLNIDGKANSRSSVLDYGAKNLTGKGVNIGFWDGFWNSGTPLTHIDFAGRYTYAETPDNYAYNHGLHTSGTMAGAGHRHPNARGMATEANIFGHTLTTGEYVQYEMYQAVKNYNITITQNSYSAVNMEQCPFGAFYDDYDRTRDQLTTMFPNLLHVFAIGNSQTACANVHGNGYGSMLGNAGKNTITVGAVSSDDLMTNFSSWGPARDGRIKPDITAVGAYNVYSTQPNNLYGSGGWNGTSMACPVVSGVAAQLYQRYQQLFSVNPSAALIKAVLCNGAKDLGNPNPDYQFGFGRINAMHAVLAIEENRFVVDNISQGITKNYTINVPANVPQVKIMLVWSDIAAPITYSATPVLVNNLNLQVSDGISTYNPWVLDPANRTAIATRGIDNLNNVEQITIDTPVAGTYQISVSGAAIPMGSQEFALTWEMNTPFIRLAYPAGNEKLSPNTNYTIVWDSNLRTGTFDVEYSADNGGTWNPIATGLANTVQQVAWTTPAIASNQVVIRIKNASFSASSTNFTILEIPSITILSPANNSATMTWNAVAGATGYDVMQLDENTGTWFVAQSNINTNSTTLINLVNGKTYWFSVRSKNALVVSERAYAYPVVPTGAGAAVDLVLQAMPAPVSATCTAKSATEDVSITIKNNGTNNVLAGTTIPVSYQINAQAIVSEAFNLSTDLLAGASISYTFTQKANLSAIASYSIVTKVNLATDLFLDNNSLTTNIKNIAIPTFSITGTPNLCAGSTNLTANVPINSYSTTTIAFSPNNVSAGTILNLGDNDGTSALPIGFSFKFFDNTYNNIYITSNGLVGFTDDFTSNYAYKVHTIPNTNMPNNFIAFAWADLAPNIAGTIRYLQAGIAPNRKFIVDFQNVRFAGSLNFVTAQLVIFEDNSIEIHTGVNPNTGTNKTMGMEGEFGTFGMAVAGRNNAQWGVINEGLRFQPITEGFIWQPNGETTKNISVTQGGIYTASYTQNGCTYSQNVTVTGSKIYVRKDGNDSNNGLANNPSNAKLTLQAALNIAADCDIVVLNTGTYNETATLSNKSITLQSIGNPILQTLVVNGTGKTLTLTGNLNISEMVNLQAGDIATAGNLTLTATATKQAMLIQAASTNVTGNVNVQRYLRANTGTASLGYRFLSSPTSDATLQQISELSPVVNASFNTSATPGRVTPFPTVYSYDASKAGDASKTFTTSPSPEFDKGWVSPATLTETMSVGKGFTVNTSANQVVEITGTVNNGNITVPIIQGNANSLGYNLVGNPYPSPIFWSSVRALSSGVNDAMYQNIATGQYTGSWGSFVNGVGTNNATDTIAVMQGFFVVANATGNVVFNNSVRATSYKNPNSFRTEDDNNYNKNTSKNNGLLRFAIRNTAGKTDETVIYFADKATQNFDSQLDAKKIQLNGGNFPNIYSTNNKELYAINALQNLTDDLVIPITVQSWTSGTQKIMLSEKLNFAREVQVFLRDKSSNTLHDFGKGAFEFSMTAGVLADRFEIVLQPQLTQAELAGDIVNVYPNPSTEILHISMADTYKGELTLKLIDVSGREVWNYQAEKTSKIYENSVNISHLVSGTYLLEVAGDKKIVKKIVKQ